MEISHTIKNGQIFKKEFLVETEHTAAHIGSGSVKVLATPMMIAFMEITSRTLLDKHLPVGFSSVGTRVDVRHLAPTALGKAVRIQVEVEAIEGKKITLQVSALEGEKKVGVGTHEGYLIGVAKFLEKLT